MLKENKQEHYLEPKRHSVRTRLLKISFLPCSPDTFSEESETCLDFLLYMYMFTVFSYRTQNKTNLWIFTKVDRSQFKKSML